MKDNLMKTKPRDDETMLKEYDFTGGKRGKYAKRAAQGGNLIAIDADVAEYFPDHDSVNEALRSLSVIIKKQRKSTNQ